MQAHTGPECSVDRGGGGRQETPSPACRSRREKEMHIKKEMSRGCAGSLSLLGSQEGVARPSMAGIRGGLPGPAGQIVRETAPLWPREGGGQSEGERLPPPDRGGRHWPRERGAEAAGREGTLCRHARPAGRGGRPSR